MKALVIDDSTTMRRIEITQLQVLGVSDIVEATNGEEGLSKLISNMPIDLILLDINMPVMDGMQLLQRIRSDAAFKQVKIIMCTSEAEKKKVIDAMKLGATSYIVKPFTPETFRDKVGPHLS